MTAQIDLGDLVKKAIVRNVAAYHAKHSMKSLDASKFDGDTEPLADHLAELSYCADAAPPAGVSTLLPMELDALIAGRDWTIAGEVEQMRARAEAGEGWRSTLDLQAVG